jgi:hypothetical protein
MLVGRVYRSGIGLGKFNQCIAMHPDGICKNAGLTVSWMSAIDERCKGYQTRHAIINF